MLCSSLHFVRLRDLIVLSDLELTYTDGDARSGASASSVEPACRHAPHVHQMPNDIVVRALGHHHDDDAQLMVVVAKKTMKTPTTTKCEGSRGRYYSQ